MRTIKSSPFSRDKKVIFVGFKSDKNFEIENRIMWSEIILRDVHCNLCKSQESITFHTKDIPKLIKALNKLMELQRRKL